MFRLAFYKSEDVLMRIIEFPKLSKVMEEVKINNKGIDKFEIYADEWKNHYLSGKVKESGSIDWIREPG